MLINCFLLAICVSIDALSIGITYSLKNTKILFGAKCILFIVSTVITLFSILLGNLISSIFPTYITKFVGCILLCFMGFWIIFESLINKNKEKITNEKKVYQFFIRFLGITIQIIRNPSYSDLDKSNQIDSKEALYLGIALSLDSIGIGIGGSIIGLNSFFFPILVAIFQLFFLSLGDFCGTKIRNISNIPENIWSIIAGFLLIFIGLSKLMF